MIMRWAGSNVIIAALAIIAGMHLCARAVAGEGEPSIPPGLDPGGLPVAVIGLGVDYTKKPIAECLARDGEGVLIGWDFTDNDVVPFARYAGPSSQSQAQAQSQSPAQSGAALEPVASILCDAEMVADGADADRRRILRRLNRPGAVEPNGSGGSGSGDGSNDKQNAARPGDAAERAVSLIALKTRPGDRFQIIEAIRFAADTPARIILWPMAEPTARDLKLVWSAARHYRDRLFVFPLTGALSSTAIAVQGAQTDNLILVAVRSDPVSLKPSSAAAPAADGDGPAQRSGAGVTEIVPRPTVQAGPSRCDGAATNPCKSAEASARISRALARFWLSHLSVDATALAARFREALGKWRAEQADLAMQYASDLDLWTAPTPPASTLRSTTR